MNQLVVVFIKAVVVLCADFDCRLFSPFYLFVFIDDAEEDEFSQLMSGKKKGQSTAGLTPEEQLFLNSANSEDSSSKSSCCIS